MNASLKTRDREPFIWPAAGIFIGVLVAVNPFFAPKIPLPVGIAVWVADMTLVLSLSPHPIRTRLGALTAGIALAVPCFISAAPFAKFVLMCLSLPPIVIATTAITTQQCKGLTNRLAYLCSWCGTREVRRAERRFDTPSLLQFTLAAVALYAAIAVVKSVPDSGVWLLVRWLAGGAMIFAFAQTATASHYFLTALVGVTAPALLLSPYLSTSLREFWTTRWNPATSMLFLKCCYEPLSRYGAIFGLSVCFILSAVVHTLVALMAIGRWDSSIMFGAFFIAQIPFLIAERLMRARRWSSVWRRIWTLSVLALTCPLFVEPLLQIVEPSWGPPNVILPPILGIVGFVVIANLCYALISLASCHSTISKEQFAV